MNSIVENKLFNFTIRHTIIEHPGYLEAIQKIELLHMKSKGSYVSGGLFITGHTGSGKSTIKNQYVQRYPRVEEIERTWIPVLVVDTPSTPTVKSLATAMLVGLQDPMAAKGTAEEKTERLYKLIIGCGVEILLIDEFQHFLDRAKAYEIYSVTDWLKNLINRVNIPVVIIGLPRSLAVLEMNEQLRRRFSCRHSLEPFPFYYSDDVQHFRGILQAIQSQIPLQCLSLSEMDIAERFHYATYGLIDYLAKLVDGAVQIALLKQIHYIDQRVFELAFKETIWGDCPQELNPFNSNFRMRHLSAGGEPFSFVNKEVKYQVGKATQSSNRESI